MRNKYAYTHDGAVSETLAFSALECSFPITEISSLAEQESWRKEINRPLYHIHKWWATRLGSVFRALVIGALSEPDTDIWKNFYAPLAFKNRVVLDPFMGSGTTLGEALKLGCKVIGCDINPVSTFLVRQALTNVNKNELRATFDNIKESVSHKLSPYYLAWDPETKTYEPVMHYFWVQVGSTPSGEEIPLFNRYVFSQNAYPKKKPESQIVCPKCWNVMGARYDAEIIKCGECTHEFNPQAGPVKGANAYDAEGNKYRVKDLLNGARLKQKMFAKVILRKGKKVYLPITSDDRKLYKRAEKLLSETHLPLPSMSIRSGYNTDQARAYNYKNWQDFFNSRQLLSLGLTLQEIGKIENAVLREQLICLFSGTLEFNNMFCSFKGEGTGAVRHIFSNHILKPERMPLENNPWYSGRSSGTFSALFESRLIRAKEYLNNPFELKKDGEVYSKVAVHGPLNATLVDTWEGFSATPGSALILNGDSACLPIPSKSVDAIITDPPYFDFVHYSELSDFFFAWLSPALRDTYPYFASGDSSRPQEVQHRDPMFFSKQLGNVFKECARVLKDDGSLTFSFHHSKPEGWLAIYDAVHSAGFNFVAAHPIHAEQKSSSVKSIANSPISLDAILVCRKANIEKAIFKDCTQKHLTALESARLSLSNADKFVVDASQLLIEACARNYESKDLKVKLEALHGAYLGGKNEFI